MFQNNVRPSEQGKNCLEVCPNNQDLIILESSTPKLEEPVNEETAKIVHEMENFELSDNKEDVLNNILRVLEGPREAIFLNGQRRN